MLRRIDDVLPGSPVVVGERVVTPLARRTGWVVGGRGWVLFRVAVRPESVAVDDHEHRRTAVTPVRGWQRHLTLAIVAITALLVLRTRRRPA